MLSGVMEHFGFPTSLKPVTYYDSEYHQQLVKDLKAAIHGGGLVAFTGIVGNGKTVCWRGCNSSSVTKARSKCVNR